MKIHNLKIKSAIWIILVFLCLSAESQATSSNSSKYVAQLNAVWKTVNDNFYDPNFLGIDWEKVGEEYRGRAASVKNDEEFGKLVDEMLHRLPTTHLSFRRPITSADTEIGVSMRDVNGREVVTDVWYGSDAMKAGIRNGDIIGTRRDALRGLWGSYVPVKIETCKGKKETLSIRREPYGWPFEYPSVQWKIIAQSANTSIGYVRIGHFGDDVAPLVDEAMHSLNKTSGLIIDVRDNSGGNASYVRLLSYLTKQHMAFALLSRSFLNKLGHAPEHLDAATMSRISKVSGAYTTDRIIAAFRENGGAAAFYTEDTGANRYHGQVVMLINKGTASAAEAFAENLKGLSNVKLVGQPTAGAIVGAEDFPIPGDWKLMLPTHVAYLANGNIYRDESTTPDIFIPLNREDLCNGKDTVINTALDLLQSSGTEKTR